MAQPFVSAGLRGGVDLSPLLEPTGLDLSDIQRGEVLISGQIWYDLLESLSVALDDPLMGFTVGSQSAFDMLPNLKNLRTQDASLGNLLTSMVIEAESLTSLADYMLSVRGRRAELSSKRTFKPSSRPTQADGYFAGFLYRLTKLCCGSQWNGSEFGMRICAVSVVPKELRTATVVKQGDTSGVSFTFPAKWLLLANQGEANQEPVEGNVRYTEFMSSAGMILELHLSDPSLTLTKFASITSSSTSELKRQFVKHKTSFHKELDGHRQRRAETLLANSSLQLSEIGKRVGFPDPSGFSRAFKRWTGKTPGEFRDKCSKD